MFMHSFNLLQSVIADTHQNANAGYIALYGEKPLRLCKF